MSNFFSFEGRINRAKYFLYLVLINLAILITFILLKTLVNTNSAIVNIIIIIVCIVSAVKSACVTVQRLHDIERPGTHYWLLLIPIYCIYLKLILLFKKGTDGLNEFGYDPL